MSLKTITPPDSTIRTTDASAQSGGTYPLPANSCVQVHLVVLAQDANDKTNAAVWLADYSFYRVTGAAVLMGVGNKVKDHSPGGGGGGTWDVDMLANADGSFTVQISGAAGTTIDWTISGAMEALYFPT